MNRSTFMSIGKSGPDNGNMATVCPMRSWCPSTWRIPLATITLTWLVVIYAFSDIVLTTLDQWIQYDTYSHGFIVFPMALYLVWEQRKRILTLEPRPNYWGLLLLAVIGIVWFLGNLATVLVVQQAALVVMLQVLVFSIVGWPVMQVLLYPLGFLFFAVPYGDEWVAPLQEFTASFTVKALQITGIPVFRDGWIIAIPSHTWVVAEACSGVHYVISFVVLGYLFSFWAYNSWVRRAGFILVCFVGGIVANGVRAYGSVILAHSAGAEHIIHGWILFSVVVLITFWIGLLWRQPANVDAISQCTSSVRDGKRIKTTSWRAGSLFVIGGATVMLGLVPSVAHIVVRPESGVATSILSAPKVARPWRALDGDDGSWGPRFIGADAELLKMYIADNRPVKIYIAYYRGKQRQGAELISVVNDLVPEKNWRQVSAGAAQAMINGEAVWVSQSVLQSKDRTRLMWHWYSIGGRLTSNRIYGKILGLLNFLFEEPKGSAIFALSIEIDDGKLPEAEEKLQSFLTYADLSLQLQKAE
jgi:exosortase A